MKGNPILWARRSGQAGINRIQIKLDHLAVLRCFLTVIKESGCFGISLNDTGLFCPIGHLQIFDGLFINRKESHSGPIFRAHIGDSGSIHDIEICAARAEKLNKFFHHLLLSQDLGDGQSQVSGGDTGPEFSCQMDSDNLGDRHEIGLGQHYGFRLDSAHAPAHDPGTVDHGGMRICADQGVRIEQRVLAFLLTILLGHNYSGEIFQVHLMADAGVGGTALKLSKFFCAHFRKA
ncbi:hypothetical protein H206_03316 [Candidatus Electrothrix aarhusensis]|uniref:Uncharacterized protein n=1 Tax=Candidatus Electrothrix aarhusensis TaxID=1859131 RepID=A0A3S4TA88_9BACT|nr:hypothetical protein H206_03316 [Candidatus Electrothrix aarhusensis]